MSTEKEPTETCLFPTLGDAESDRWESEEIPAVDSLVAFCQNAVEVRIILAAVWAVVLYRFVEVETIYIGLGGSLDDDGRGRTRDVLVTSVDDETPVQVLLEKETWTVMPSSAVRHARFNTGVVVEGIMGKDYCRDFTNGQDDSTSVSDLAQELDMFVVMDYSRFFLRYRSTSLSPFHATHLASSIAEAVASILHDPAQLVKEVSVFSPMHRNQVSQWNGGVTVDSGSFLHSLIAEQAVQRPAKLALAAWNGNLTFRQLDEYSSRLAQLLRNQGVEPGMMVPVCFEKSLWAVVSILAINKTGAAFVPLDPSHPSSRLKAILHQTRASMAVTSELHSQLLADHVPSVIVVSESLVMGLPVSEINCCDAATTGQVAYCFFTSGSTGKPKGCVVDHAALASLTHHTSALRLSAESRVLQFASYSFGISLIEIWCTLCAGGTVCVPSEHERVNALSKAIGASHVNWAILTPTVVNSIQPKEVPTLKTLVVAGEPLGESLILTWAGRVCLIQAYGFTEWAGICCVSRPMQSSTDRRTIGVPPNAKLWLVDARDESRLAPIGAMAELVVEGPSLARGYLDEPERTAQAFISGPAWMGSFSSDPRDRRLYKTGDLVRYDADGSISFIGRKDLQVKLRGQRIELNEVENHVQQCFDGAQKVVTEVISCTSSSRCLVAFVQWKKPEDAESALHGLLLAPSEEFCLTVTSAKEKLVDLVPSYMVPSHFLPVRHMPRTVTGKTDRRALRDCGSALSLEDLERYKKSPSVVEKCDVMTEAEFKLQCLWARVLNRPVEDIGANDDFFNLGGDSVSAMRLAAMAGSQKLSITVADVFAHPTLSALATLGVSVEIVDQQPTNGSFVFSLVDPIHARQSLLARVRGKGIVPEGCEIVDILPATGIQSDFIRRWGLDYFSFFLSGDIDPCRLESACADVTLKHSILRTLFVEEEEGLFFQVILEGLKVPFHQTTTDQELKTFCAAQRHDDAASSALDGLPLRFTLVSKSKTEHVFTIRLSHAQYDGFSIPILFHDVAAAYNNTTALAPSPAQFSSYVYHRSQQKWDKAFAFWRDFLHGSSMTTMPPRLRPLPEQVNDQTEASIDIDIGKRIQPLPQPPAGITLATLVKAAWSFVLSQFTQQPDLVFGQTVNGRSLSSLENIDRILGPCMNFTPFRVKFQCDWTVRDLLLYVQSQYQQTASYDFVEFPDIVRMCTDWSTAETRFHFIFQHQNVDHKLELPLDIRGVDDDVSALPSRYLNFRSPAEVWVFSIPYETELEVRVWAPGWMMGEETAGFLVDRVCEVVEAFSRGSGVLLSTLAWSDGLMG